MAEEECDEENWPPAPPLVHTYETERDHRRVGNYTILHTICHTGKSRIFAAANNKSGERVVVKRIPKEMPTPPPCESDHTTSSTIATTTTTTQQPQQQQQPQQRSELSGKKHKEFKIMSQLHHPHIVRLIEVIETNKAINLVLQNAEGGDLFKHIQNSGGLTQTEAWRIFRELLSALDYMHRRHYVHRDVKPENIFLGKDRNVLLGDFGLSCKWGESKRKSRCCGSFGYMSPCLLADMPDYEGPELDIWSAGVCLYQMLFKQTPFRASSNFKALTKMKRGKLRDQDMSHLPSDLLDLFRRIFCRDTSQQIIMSELMNHPWVANPPSPTRGGSRIYPVNGLRSKTLTQSLPALHQRKGHQPVAVQEKNEKEKEKEKGKEREKERERGREKEKEREEGGQKQTEDEKEKGTREGENEETDASEKTENEREIGKRRRKEKSKKKKTTPVATPEVDQNRRYSASTLSVIHEDAEFVIPDRKTVTL